uniref:Putative secreted protein n=1 Tax=Anopheles marajoara TaxID=58244 RepID=A0A2M4C8U4_9DIPT
MANHQRGALCKCLLWPMVVAFPPDIDMDRVARPNANHPWVITNTVKKGSQDRQTHSRSKQNRIHSNLGTWGGAKARVSCYWCCCCRAAEALERLTQIRAARSRSIAPRGQK